MDSRLLSVTLPPIPVKRYFTIGEVSELCAVKPHVLRYWEQEFTQLRPMKRRGNRRYYQHHEVLLIRKIRELLYDQGFTISGARNQLHESRSRGQDPAQDPATAARHDDPESLETMDASITPSQGVQPRLSDAGFEMLELKQSLTELLDLLRRPSSR